MHMYTYISYIHTSYAAYHLPLTIYQNGTDETQQASVASFELYLLVESKCVLFLAGRMSVCKHRMTALAVEHGDFAKLHMKVVRNYRSDVYICM